MQLLCVNATGLGVFLPDLVNVTGTGKRHTGMYEERAVGIQLYRKTSVRGTGTPDATCFWLRTGIFQRFAYCVFLTRITYSSPLPP